MSTAYCASRISENMARDNAGFLLCLATPICRSGTQRYRGTEIGLDNDDPVTIYRPRSEVMSPATIASFESKPLTDDHPPRMLDPGNAQLFAKGHLRNVRPGPPLPDGEIPLVADLVVTDSALIEKILHGKRELSAGYDTTYVTGDNGTLIQTAIRANHCAVVNTGRAGSAISIRDSKESEDDMTPQQEEKVKELTAAINNLCGLMRDEQQTTNRRGPNLARTMLGDAERITRRLATPEGPVSLHRFITEASDDLPSAGSIQRDEMKRASGAAFEDACNSVGARMRGEKDCRSSLRRSATDTTEESFEDMARARRQQLLGR